MADLAFIGLNLSSTIIHDADIIDIAVVVVDSLGLYTLESYSSLISLENKVITAAATARHHITSALVSKAPAFASIASALFSLLDGKVWVGHALSDSTPMLLALWSNIDKHPPEAVGLIDTLQLYRRVLGGDGHHHITDVSTEALCHRYRLPHHDRSAAADAKLQIEILKSFSTSTILEKLCFKEMGVDADTSAIDVLCGPVRNECGGSKDFNQEHDSETRSPAGEEVPQALLDTDISAAKDTNVSRLSPPTPALSGWMKQKALLMVDIDPIVVLSDMEKEIVAEINLARTDPKTYATFLGDYKEKFRDGNVVVKTKLIHVVTSEGLSAVNEAIEWLLTLATPVPPLMVSQGLCLAALDHVLDTGPIGIVEHSGTDGSTSGGRANRYGEWLGKFSESILFGDLDARTMVITMIVDDGVQSRGRRRNLFSTETKVVGLALGYHKVYGCMCVLDRASGYKEDPSLINLSALELLNRWSSGDVPSSIDGIYDKLVSTKTVDKVISSTVMATVSANYELRRQLVARGALHNLCNIIESSSDPEVQWGAVYGITSLLGDPEGRSLMMENELVLKSLLHSADRGVAVIAEFCLDHLQYDKLFRTPSLIVGSEDSDVRLTDAALFLPSQSIIQPSSISSSTPLKSNNDVSLTSSMNTSNDIPNENTSAFPPATTQPNSVATVNVDRGSPAMEPVSDEAKWNIAKKRFSQELETYPFLTDFERDVVAEICMARTYPLSYAAYLNNEKQYFDGKVLRKAGVVPLQTDEGIDAYNDAIDFLQNQARSRPLSMVTPVIGLSLSCLDHVLDHGPAGKFGHIGSDKSTPQSRSDRYGAWSGILSENVSFGCLSGRDIVAAQIVDDGISERGHRSNLFSDRVNVVGVSIGYHKTFGVMAVVCFSMSYKDTLANDGVVADPRASIVAAGNWLRLYSFISGDSGTDQINGCLLLAKLSAIPTYRDTLIDDNVVDILLKLLTKLSSSTQLNRKTVEWYLYYALAQLSRDDRVRMMLARDDALLSRFETVITKSADGTAVEVKVDRGHAAVASVFLTCHHCKFAAGPNFFIHEHRPFCYRDFRQYYAPRCAGCGEAAMPDQSRVWSQKNNVSVYWHTVCHSANREKDVSNNASLLKHSSRLHPHRDCSSGELSETGKVSTLK